MRFGRRGTVNADWDFQVVAADAFELGAVDRLANYFGSSFEATVYRLATANPNKAVAGLLKYRLSLPEQRAVKKKANQRNLFASTEVRNLEMKPKYRRQSLHLAHGCGNEYRIHWNKSFDSNSIVYTAADGGAVSAFEELPNESGETGRLEAILAPYQREDAHPEFGDVLFVWQER